MKKRKPKATASEKKKSDIEAVRAALRGPIKSIEEMPTTASELLRKVESIVKEGTGIEKRLKEMEAFPSKYSRDDGVIFDSRWQDDIAG